MRRRRSPPAGSSGRVWLDLGRIRFGCAAGSACIAPVATDQPMPLGRARRVAPAPRGGWEPRHVARYGRPAVNGIPSRSLA